MFLGNLFNNCQIKFIDIEKGRMVLRSKASVLFLSLRKHDTESETTPKSPKKRLSRMRCEPTDMGFKSNGTNIARFVTQIVYLPK